MFSWKSAIVWSLLAVLSTGSVVAVAGVQEDEQITEALTIFNRAKYLHQEKRFDEAINEYRRALQLDNENPWIYNSLGLALAAKRKFDDALAAFEDALKLNPDLTDVHNNIGVVYAEMGKRDKAFESFGRVVRDPTYPTPEKALFNLGELYVQEKNYELALMHYRRAVEKEPNFAIGFRGMGIAHLGLGDKKLAKEQFEKAIEIEPDETGSLYELARLNDEEGNEEKALELYRRVIEVDRFSPLGQLSLRRLDALKPSEP